MGFTEYYMLEEKRKAAFSMFLEKNLGALVVNKL